MAVGIVKGGDDKMKCPKCNSGNVNIQAKEVKPKLILPMCLVFGGFGTMLLGIFGTIIGVILGLIIGAVLQSVFPSGQQSVMVCQQCGYVSKPIAQKNLSTTQHSLFCSESESNLDIVRNDIDKGTIIVIRIRIDNYAPFDIGDNSTINVKLPNGNHNIYYEQLNGIGKKRNKGQVNIIVGEKQTITISFTRQRLIVK